MAEEPMDSSTIEISENQPTGASSDSQPDVVGSESPAVEPPAIEPPAVEPPGGNADSISTPTKTDESGKRVYTEEERLKRKAYFKQLKDKRRSIRDKARQSHLMRNRVLTSKPRSQQASSPPRDTFISFNMTEEDKKMLEFYKVRLSTLKTENEQLHRRLASLIRENMRLLQMGPPLKAA